MKNYEGILLLNDLLFRNPLIGNTGFFFKARLGTTQFNVGYLSILHPSRSTMSPKDFFFTKQSVRSQKDSL